MTRTQGEDIDAPAGVLFPPVGIAYILARPADIIAHRMDGVGQLHVMTAAQPNGPPHLGTMCMLMTAFALAAELKAVYRVPATVMLDVLDNGPHEERSVGGRIFTRSLADCAAPDGVIVAERHLRSFSDLMSRLRSYSGVQFAMRSYADFQRTPAFRRNLIRVLGDADVFAPVIEPSTSSLRVRIPCPVCRWTDKAGASVQWERASGSCIVISALCPDDGRHACEVTATNASFVDTNTPLRSVLKAAMFIELERETNLLTVSVDGADWSGTWYSRIVVEGLGHLGYPARLFPSQVFAPMILDWSGAKLSKTLYVQEGAYRVLPAGVSDFDAFMGTFGEAGLEALWDEVQCWPKDSRRLFRNYSIDYLLNVLTRGGAHA